MTAPLIPSLRSQRRRALIGGLTERESALVEALADGLTYAQAAQRAGGAFKRPNSGVRNVVARPHVAQALEARHQALRDKFALKREDIVKGIMSAIDDARLLSDPATQIKGWTELARMFGYYEPERRVVEISVEEATARQQLATMSNEDLARLAGGAIYDAVFSEVTDDDDAFDRAA